jgi:acetyl esterase/lipase
VQAALIVDVLRAHQLVMDGPSFAGLVDKVIFMGHSLGGACSIIAAAKVQVRY